MSSIPQGAYQLCLDNCTRSVAALLNIILLHTLILNEQMIQVICSSVGLRNSYTIGAQFLNGQSIKFKFFTH
jgi:hypothetical protein